MYLIWRCPLSVNLVYENKNDSWHWWWLYRLGDVLEGGIMRSAETEKCDYAEKCGRYNFPAPLKKYVVDFCKKRENTWKLCRKMRENAGKWLTMRLWRNIREKRGTCGSHYFPPPFSFPRTTPKQMTAKVRNWGMDVMICLNTRHKLNRRAPHSPANFSICTKFIFELACALLGLCCTLNYILDLILIKQLGIRIGLRRRGHTTGGIHWMPAPGLRCPRSRSRCSLPGRALQQRHGIYKLDHRNGSQVFLETWSDSPVSAAKQRPYRENKTSKN